MELTDENRFDEMEGIDIVKKWNIYMQDLLVTKSSTNTSPVEDELTEVFQHKLFIKDL